MEALGRSVIDAVDTEAPGSELSVFDDGWGVRHDTAARYGGIRLEHVGVRQSRRWHRPESWAQIRVAQAFGGLRNPAAMRLATADAVLDISGGDSFTDMYGPKRFRHISAPKQAALRARRPLVLLPQTYGPFSAGESRQTAARFVRSAALAYARDTESYHRLLELGGEYSSHLRDGVDVAFALRARRPNSGPADAIDAASEEVLAGVNVSGLLCGPTAASRFGLAGDYLATMTELVQRLVNADAMVMLVPHVHVNSAGESDIVAIDLLRRALPASTRSRTLVAPPDWDAAQLKWAISRCAWLAGSRMHATIAALSSGVPAAAYAYSDKTLGVFQTCGSGDQVVDARTATGSVAVMAMMHSFEGRDRTALVLSARVAAVVDRARGQLTEILAAVASWRGQDTWSART